MSVELDVFVGNTTIMDEEVYQFWLDGYTVNDAVKVRMEGGVLEECEASAEVLHSDTMDQYRTFQMCERLLHSPAKLANQLLFQIPPHRQAMLIERFSAMSCSSSLLLPLCSYVTNLSVCPSVCVSVSMRRYYAFDGVFVREVLGKKLSKGTKKDLDDVSAKTGVTLKSCRRQFDNFKRVFKVVEELKGPLVENIRQHFLLSDQLARNYAAIVFFANNRFETGKKKLHYLTFQDFAFCAGQLISYWTVGAVDNMVEDMDVDLEKQFLQDLKELKILITDKDLLDQHKSLVCTALRGKTKVFNEMETNFKNLSRGLVNIAVKLTNTKDVRDFFIDLVEKFIEPCRSDKWTAGDMRLFLTHYTNSAHILDTFKHQVLWDRYMGVIKSCILKMYHD
ncbi:fibroblast growth factor (acidic) intracellular binding protein a isoform X2 [Esox lucius]|nr:fibroblast growth factor (acidic) intracellular binding protein a isoform X2 [Esox lucius]XP_034147508.1 fibroblast growth factor (acidic) intracellular binding protein a isoform X2 [Esox lucius]